MRKGVENSKNSREKERVVVTKGIDLQLVVGRFEEKVGGQEENYKFAMFYNFCTYQI